MKISVNNIIKKAAFMSVVMTLLLCSVGLVVLADGPVTGVSLDKDTLSITIGKQATLIATVLPENATNKAVTWASLDASIASVDSTGIVTAHKLGSTTITVTTVEGSKTAACVVTVTPPVTNITAFGQNKFNLNVGQEQRLTAVLTPPEATNYVWSSSNSSIASVNSEGLVTALAPGTVTVKIASADDETTAADESIINAVYTVNVIQPVNKIELSHTSLLLCDGETIKLSAAVFPENASDKTVTWSTSDDQIATVADGEVKIYSVGNVRITASSGGCQAICDITVKPGKISSSKYNALESGLLTGVSKLTVLPNFKASLNNDSADIKVYKPDGSELTGGIVGTGAIVKLFVDGKERDSLGVVVSGDADGDGSISIFDYTYARLDILGIKPIDGIYRFGADVDNDGKITIYDYTLMRFDILGLKPISTPMPELPDVTNPQIRRFLDVALSLQGKPYAWSEEGPDSFDCSGYVYYCLNQAGYSVGRSTANTYSINEKWQYVDRNALQPGDLMFYWSDSKPGYIGHVGIYLGNGYHIHASSDYGYVVICRVEGWYDRMLSHGRRVFN
jgi:uncharacterized protein YjdB